MSDLPEEIVAAPGELAACCDHLSGHSHFGFDTEFVGEDTYHPRLCLIQAATPDRLFLIDPLSAGPLDAFWDLVVDPGRVVVVHAGREEVRLCRLGAGKTPGNLFDLQIAAGMVGMTYPLGHGPLVGQVLGVRLSKGETRTEWRDRPLTPEQIRYAFDDVRYLLPTWGKLSGRLEKMGRTEWAREEFTRLARTASPEEPIAEEKWRKLRGIGSLDRRRLAAARALFNWREETAARTNRPARTIVRRRSDRRDRPTKSDAGARSPDVARSAAARSRGHRAGGRRGPPTAVGRVPRRDGKGPGPATSAAVGGRPHGRPRRRLRPASPGAQPGRQQSGRETISPGAFSSASPRPSTCRSRTAERMTDPAGVIKDVLDGHAAAGCTASPTWHGAGAAGYGGAAAKIRGESLSDDICKSPITLRRSAFHRLQIAHDGAG